MELARDNFLLFWRNLGLRFLPHGGSYPLTIAMASGLAFGAYMAIADATLFRSAIPASQTALVEASSAVQRIVYFVPMAMLDELKFRLVAMSAIVWLLTALAGRREWCFWIAILATALVAYPAFNNAYLGSLAPSFPTFLREVMLHGCAGILWGWLYWRHGLVAAIVGHVSAHFALQPMLGSLF